jgi:hypothetical protein
VFEATPRLLTGRIVALQEQRFRLASDSGQVYLLTLGRHAPLDAETLADLHARGARVSVAFRGEPNLADGVAYMVAEAPR